MPHQEKFTELANGMNGVTTDNDLSISTEIMDGDVKVLMVIIEDREEFPIYITVDESQILCISHLWTESEIVADKRMDLLDAMLTMNLPMPLSSFSKLGKQYLIFGALSTHSSLDEVLEEIDNLSNNTLTAIEELSEFLNAAS